MAEMATDLLTEFKQGSIVLHRVTKAAVDEEQPWVRPVETSISFPLFGVAKRVDQRYENGLTIVETGDVVTFAPFASTPVMTDKVSIDGGEQRAIKSIKRVPSAGTVIVWKVFVLL